MKKILALLFALISVAGAATSALYLHHERSTQATTEADCQNRELCLDKTNLAPLGRFNDGTLFHVVTQEKPNVNLAGSLTLTGAAVLSNNLTLSLIPTDRIPYTTTGGLFTSGAGLTYNGTTLGVNNGTFSGTTTTTGVATFTAPPVFSSATASLPMFTNGSKALVSNAMTGTGSVMMSVSPASTGTATFVNTTNSGTLAVTGAATISSTLTFTDATANINFSASDGSDNGRLTLTAAGGTNGNVHRGSYISLRGNENASPGLIQIVGGDVVGGNIDFFTGNGIRRGGFAYAGAFDVVGAATFGSTVVATGNITTDARISFTSFGSTTTGAILRSAVDGLLLRGVTGSANDLSLWSAAGTLIMRNPTGTTNMTFDGSVSMASILAVTGATTITPLAGTGTRLVTSTAAGVLGNATTIAGANTWSDIQTFTAAPVFSSATASLPMFTDGSKGLASNAMTGTGSVMMSVSPASTGTATFVNSTNSGTLGVTGATTLASTLAVTGAITGSNLSGTNTGNQTITLTGGVTGSGTSSFAATVITNANLTGPITSVGNATSVASQTGTGSTFAMSAGPAFTGTATFVNTTNSGTLAVTGAATATTIALGGNEAFDYDEGSFTGTISTGCATTPTFVIYYVRIGKDVTLNLGTATNCASNSTTLVVSGLPASLQTVRQVFTSCSVFNSSTRVQGCVLIAAASGDLRFGTTTSSLDNFTNDGLSKGFATSGYTFSYTLQ